MSFPSGVLPATGAYYDGLYGGVVNGLRLFVVCGAGNSIDVTNITTTSLTVTTENVTNLTVDNFYTDLFVIEYAPVTIVSNTYNNYNLTGQSKVAFSSTGGASTITGFAGGVNGQIVYVLNNGTANVTLANQNGSSLLGNRIACPWGANYILFPGREIILQYDGANAVWRFATPTLAIGTGAGIQTSGCDQVIIGAGLAQSDNGDGSNTISSGLTVENANTPLHAVLGPTTVKANNDQGSSSYGRVYWDGTALNFQGLIAYLAGTGPIGPFIDFEFTTGATLAIALDPAATSPTGRDALKLTIPTGGGGGYPSLTTGQVSQTTGYSATSSPAQVTGMDIMLPAIGTYLITATMQWSVTGTTVLGNAVGKLRDTTAGIDITPSNLQTYNTTAPGATGGTISFTCLHATTVVNQHVQLWANYSGMGTPTLTIAGSVIDIVRTA